MDSSGPSMSRFASHATTSWSALCSCSGGGRSRSGRTPTTSSSSSTVQPPGRGLTDQRIYRTSLSTPKGRSSAWPGWHSPRGWRAGAASTAGRVTCNRVTCSWNFEGSASAAPSSSPCSQMRKLAALSTSRCTPRPSRCACTPGTDSVPALNCGGPTSPPTSDSFYAEAIRSRQPRPCDPAHRRRARSSEVISVAAPDVPRPERASRPGATRT